MSLLTRMPVFRMPSLKVLLSLGAALVAVAAPASALLGLPVSAPDVSQHIDTPVSSSDVSAGEQGLDTCNNVYTPAVPALPALPTSSLPVPVPAIPALPDTSASADQCLHAGLDGASTSIGADAAGHHVGASAEASSPVDAQQVSGDAQSTAGEAKGFFDGLMDTLFGWI